MSDDLITALVLRRGALSWTTLQRKKNRLEVVENKIATFEWPAGVTEWQAPEVVERIKPLCAQIKGRVALALPTDAALLRVVRLPTVEAEEIRDMVALQVDKFSPFPVDQMSVSLEIAPVGDQDVRHSWRRGNLQLPKVLASLARHSTLEPGLANRNYQPGRPRIT